MRNHSRTIQKFKRKLTDRDSHSANPEIAEAKELLDSIPNDSLSGLRDRALIATMLYSFARVSAALKLKVDDYYHNGAGRWLRLYRKGGKEHEMPVHHLLEETLNEYIAAAGLQNGQPFTSKPIIDALSRESLDNRSVTQILGIREKKDPYPKGERPLRRIAEARGLFFFSRGRHPQVGPAARL